MDLFSTFPCLMWISLSAPGLAPKHGSRVAFCHWSVVGYTVSGRWALLIAAAGTLPLFCYMFCSFFVTWSTGSCHFCLAAQINSAQIKLRHGSLRPFKTGAIIARKLTCAKASTLQHNRCCNTRGTCCTVLQTVTHDM